MTLVRNTRMQLYHFGRKKKPLSNDYENKNNELLLFTTYKVFMNASKLLYLYEMLLKFDLGMYE